MADQKLENPDEYLLFVRVPEPVDDDLDATTKFLDRVARLLSDDDHHIYVEQYRDYNEEEPKTPRGKHDYEGEGYRGNSPAGGRKNSLQPMYFCHGKF
jgi:hypothetical protein